MRSAQDLLTELNASDESPRIEAKRSREMGKSVMETVTAFANEPGLGGHLLLGVDWAVSAKDRHPVQGKLPLEGGKQASEGGKRSLPPLPPGLAEKLPVLKQRMGESALRQLIRDLC